MLLRNLAKALDKPPFINKVSLLSQFCSAIPKKMVGKTNIASVEGQVKGIVRRRSPSPTTATVTYTPKHYKKRKVDNKPKIGNKPKEVLPILNVDDLQSTIFMYTDGSCFGNRDVANTVNPAGWGVVALKFKDSAIPHIQQTFKQSNLTTIDLSSSLSSLSSFLSEEHCELLAELYGPVVTPSNKKLTNVSLGATVGSNNTGELSAIGEGLLWLQNHGPISLVKPKRCFILFDSEYAARSVLRIYNGEKNKELIESVRNIYDTLQTTLQSSHNTDQNDRAESIGISFVHVKAHSNDFYNDRADALAKEGNSGRHCTVGRYAAFSTVK